MKKCLLAFLFAICFIPAFSQNVYNGSLQTTDPTFNRPDEGMPPVALSLVGTNVYYNLITINVPIAGVVTFSSNSAWDNFMVLYNTDGFTPDAPLVNSLLANDDFEGPNSGFSYNFPTTGNYYLVICSFKNSVTGLYSITQSAAMVLPLRLLSFTAGKATGNSNMLKWSSAEESNLISYQVQRGIDDNNFNDLTNGSIAAKNTPTNTYSFMDNNPAPAVNYYRLKITERTGRISYSPVAHVRNNKAGITNLKVFPNPASDYLQIEGKSLQNKKAIVSLINAGGKIMHTGQYFFNNQAVLFMDIKRFSAGKYFLKTTIDKDEATLMFIKN